MSNLNPGGCRNAYGRVFDAASIARMCKPQIDRAHRLGHNSIAQGNRHGGKHEHKREKARRQRQAGC